MIKGLAEKEQKPEKLEIRPMITFISKLNKASLIGAEIGTLYGINAHAILSTLSINKLYLIDPYALYPEYLDIQTPFAWRAERHANSLLLPFQDKITKLKKFSSEAVSDIPDELDFIYIDGNHSYEFVKADIENYWPKIKKGGVLGGHDYYNSGKAREVKRAVDEFVEKNKLKLYAEDIDWWIVKN